MMNTPVNTPLHMPPEDELPDWMLRAMRGTDWGVLIVLALSLLMGWSFGLYPGLPHTNATESYVFRAADTAAALQEGRLYPRWSPHALSGYGAPIPNYYPPGAPYTIALLETLFTADTVLATRLVLIAAFGLAGTMVYALVLRRVHAPAGVTAALLYVYSPYVGLVAPHVIGDVVEMMALALLPALLWAVNRQLQRHQPADAIFVTLTAAALMLTSPAHFLVGIGLALLLVGLHFYERQPLRPAFMTLTGILLGLLLSSFYWLPALVERDAVRWLPAALPVATESLTLMALFQLPRQIDPSALATPPQWTLGIPLPLFALGALLYTRRITFQSVFLVAGIGLLIFALVVTPQATWLLGSICLCLAIGGSAALDWRTRLRPSLQRVALSGVTFFIFIMAIPVWMSPRYDADFGEITPALQVRYEQQGLGIAVLPPGALIPSSLSTTTTPNRLLLSGYASDSVNRFSDDPTLQNQASVLFVGSHSQQYQIRLREPITLRLLAAYFPGWQAYLNGQPLPTSADEPTGLIKVEVPRVVGGDFVLTLDETPARGIAWLLTIGTLFVVLVGFWRRTRNYRPPRTLLLRLLSPAETRLLALTLLLTGGGAYIANQLDTPYTLRAQGQYALRESLPLRNRSDIGLEAFYYQLETSTYAVGDTIDVTLYWQTALPLSSNYQTRLTLRDVNTSQEWTSTVLRHPGFIPTRRWTPGLYVTDRYAIPIPADLPAGRYLITVAAYPCMPECNLNVPLRFFAPNGSPVGTAVTLPRILTIE